jgi:hypothetical protein
MDDIASPQELFDDLTRLPQAGRLRYMKGLSREVLIEVLALSLQTTASSGRDERGGAGTTANRNLDATGGAQQRKRSHDSSSTTLHVEKKPELRNQRRKVKSRNIQKTLL